MRICFFLCVCVCVCVRICGCVSERIRVCVYVVLLPVLGSPDLWKSFKPLVLKPFWGIRAKAALAILSNPGGSRNLIPLGAYVCVCVLVCVFMYVCVCLYVC